ncbi:MAG: trypsin-like peptidase domain-containing protein [Proteobacteria bacterium]|nr:trypsin-like peptidase domain-containing protein [Pseudomonadota bacterium]
MPSRLTPMHLRCALAAGLLLFASACQPDQLHTGSQGQAPAAYSVFYSQGQHVEDLVKAGDFAAAAKVFADHPAFFGPERRVRHAAALGATADGLLREIEPDLRAASAALADADPAIDNPARWNDVRAALAQAQAALARHDAVPLLADPAYATQAAADLRTRYADMTGRMVQRAPDALRAHDLAAEPGFFALYPVPLDAKAVLRAALDGGLRARLEAALPADLARFAGTLGSAGALDGESEGEIANLLARAHARSSGGAPGSLRAVMSGISAVRAAGLTLPKFDGLKVGFVQATSQTLLRAGQIEFPAEIDIDLPFEAKKVELDRAYDGGDDDFLVVFDVALARVNRRVSGMESIVSRRQVGTRQEPNPDYEIVRIQVQNAQMAYQQAQMSASMSGLQGGFAGLFGSIAGAVEASQARDNIGRAMQRLRDTPQTVMVPVSAEYEFRRARVDGSRAMTVNYYVVDRKAGTYVKSSFDISENQQFRVGYDIDRNDPAREQHLAEGHTEKDVTDWETAPMKMPMSRLVENYLQQQGRAQKLTSLVALRDELLRDKNTALARFETTKIQDSRTTDARMESVVRIFVSKGSGSGFFVMPDLVLTNQHVVQDQKIVEMKLSNGLETFGRVEAVDVRLDLALVRVQARGKPVRFFDGQRLDLGATVEVLGHPRGFDFSVTRGVVSAVRSNPSINRVAGKPVTFVQIDAATSPGNSGGPIFLGDRVIGVVDWGRTDAQNVNFGIHYSEVLEWLREKNIQVVTSR